MKNHKLKIENEYLKDLNRGVKTFEIRHNDRDYKVGDILSFEKKWNDESTTIYSFGVNYIHTGLGLLPNYVILGVVPLNTEKQ